MKYQRKILAAGRYEAVCISAEEKLSKNGKEMIEMRWEADGCEVKGYLTPAMGWIIDQIKTACGFDLDTNAESDITPKDILGKRALIDITCEMFNDQPQNKISKYLPSSLPPVEMAPF